MAVMTVTAVTAVSPSAFVSPGSSRITLSRPVHLPTRHVRLLVSLCKRSVQSKMESSTERGERRAAEDVPQRFFAPELINRSFSLNARERLARQARFPVELPYEVSRSGRPSPAFPDVSPIPRVLDAGRRRCCSRRRRVRPFFHSRLYTLESQFDDDYELCRGCIVERELSGEFGPHRPSPGQRDGRPHAEVPRLLSKRNPCDADNVPTPGTMVADLMATHFLSGVSDVDMDDDTSPLAYLAGRMPGQGNFDEIHECAEEHEIFEHSTS